MFIWERKFERKFFISNQAELLHHQTSLNLFPQSFLKFSFSHPFYHMRPHRTGGKRYTFVNITMPIKHCVTRNHKMYIFSSWIRISFHALPVAVNILGDWDWRKEGKFRQIVAQIHLLRQRIPASFVEYNIPQLYCIDQMRFLLPSFSQAWRLPWRCESYLAWIVWTSSSRILYENISFRLFTRH